MLDWLNQHIDTISLLWLLPVCFMFHDFEEILTVESWGITYGNRVEAAIPPRMRKMYKSSMRMTTRNFALDVLFVYFLIVSVTAAAVFFSFYTLYLAVTALFLLHVFTHFGQSIYLKLYTPGVVTALFIALPYSLYAFYRLLSEKIVGLHDFGWALLLLFLLTPPVVWGLLKSRGRHQRT
ncbi:HXXEE domain-containing protein [Paenibacillus typhae]|uniref:HXXEE domain-containing protein n=1 Tax=Paenibacillus typhae TaxID=1174501 RepID=A0A1G8YDR5_9BACL|nr:HXXEE domain-containing protein [Paenibacillus typhae]SDK01059.1 Protein of unknown function with HXXEE motif-containing protein [Paenibacillus typhae]